MKKSFLLSATAALVLTSCHRERHYICQCWHADSLVTHTIGRSSQQQAYTQCQAMKDSTNNCYMEVRR